MCYTIIGDDMKIEKWMYKGEEIEVPILEDDEIEENLKSNVDLEKTKDLSEELNVVGVNNE